MSPKNIRLIFLREVRDQLRDRRTLFMVAILPLLLYPVLGIGVLQMMLLFTEQPRTVVVLGADELPETPALLEKGRFVKTWFQLGSEAEKLHVLTEQDITKGVEEADPTRLLLLRQARDIRKLVAEKEQLEPDLEAARKAGDKAQEARLASRLDRVDEELNTLFRQSDLQVLIIVPEGFAEAVAKAEQFGTEEWSGPLTRPTLVRNQADEKSQIAYMRIREAMDAWWTQIWEKPLQRAGVPPDILTKSSESVDVARQEQLSATLWSKLVPALLVIMAVTGAFYPAIDLAAGEKERGTMETLLICPASRGEIVLGKFFTVLLFSIGTAVLNVLSMGLTGKYMSSLADGGGGAAIERMGTLQPPTGPALLWIVVLLVPLAALFSALCLSLATFARSSKEGQYYLTPLLMVTMGLTIFSILPGVEITPFYSTMPVVGVALLLKKALAAPGSTETFFFAVPVLVTSIAYSLLALWWAIEQFSREEVLFREAERVDVRLWVRHLLRDKEPTPSFAEAGFCFLMIMLLQFGALKFFGDAIRGAPDDVRPLRTVQLLMIQQLVIVACPALFMGIILTTDVRRTFRLRWPSWKMLGVSVVLGLALVPPSVELLNSLHGWYFHSSPLLEEVSKAIGSPDLPWWLIVVAFGLIPPVCEELTFRGFILSGFLRSNRVWLAIGLASVTFGIMHQVPQQVFNATLLGLILGLLAVRSGSVLPGIVFHMVYNTLNVTTARFAPALAELQWTRWFVRVDESGVGYEWPTLLVSIVAAALTLRWLVNQSSDVRERRERVEEGLAAGVAPQLGRQPSVRA